MKGIPHEFTNVAELGDTTNQSSSGSEYTIQRSQANKREAKTKRRAIRLLVVNITISLVVRHKFQYIHVVCSLALKFSGLELRTKIYL